MYIKKKTESNVLSGHEVVSFRSEMYQASNYKKQQIKSAGSFREISLTNLDTASVPQ